MNLDPDLEKRFTYHPPNTMSLTRYTTIRTHAKALAYAIRAVCPVGREQALALTRLEETVMWANAAIARETPQLPPVEGDVGV